MGFAIGGAILGSALISADASGKAAGAQADAAKDANWTQNHMFQAQRDDAAPWRAAGVKALDGMGSDDFQKDFSMSDFTKDPGYQFRLDEGNKAINASASARGMANSGATMKALTKYGQDFATGEYQNAYNRFNQDRTTRYNRLSNMAGLGQTSNGQVMNAGTNAANQIGQNQMAMGNAQAAGQIGQANAISGAVGNGMNSWMNYQMMNKMNPQQPAQNNGTMGSMGSSGSTGYGSSGQSTSDFGSFA